MLIAENYRIELHLRPMLHRAHFDYKGGNEPFAAASTKVCSRPFATVLRREKLPECSTAKIDCLEPSSTNSAPRLSVPDTRGTSRAGRLFEGWSDSASLLH
jgi:hypothetical protein